MCLLSWIDHIILYLNKKGRFIVLWGATGSNNNIYLHTVARGGNISEGKQDVQKETL